MNINKLKVQITWTPSPSDNVYIKGFFEIYIEYIDIDDDNREISWRFEVKKGDNDRLDWSTKDITWLNEDESRLISDSLELHRPKVIKFINKVESALKVVRDNQWHNLG